MLSPTNDRGQQLNRFPMVYILGKSIITGTYDDLTLSLAMVSLKSDMCRGAGSAYVTPSEMLRRDKEQVKAQREVAV